MISDEALYERLLAGEMDAFDRLYERYEHRELRVNVGLDDADFDPNNPAYDF